MLMCSLRFSNIILLLLCWVLSSVHLCASDNRLVAGKPLSPGSTIVSDDGTFALGFFSPSNPKKHHYVGIWYNNIPEFTVVWVANRAVPITDASSAALALTGSSGGGLTLSDSNGHVVWTTTTAAAAAVTGNVSTEAMIENTGNLVLRSLADNAILWQSFDHPTDTLLPGMNLRLSHNTHPLQRLVSWNGAEDPSPGPFSYGADPDNLLQRFIWHGSAPHRRSPVWHSYLLLGSYSNSNDNDNLMNSTIYMAINHDGDEVYMSFGMPTAGPSSALIRMEIDYLGKVNMLFWQSNTLAWASLFSEPARECDVYGYCGPNGYCDNTETVSTCKCLDGFEPAWSSGGGSKTTFSRGCRRRRALRCGHGNGFLVYPGMKVPDRFVHVRNRSFDECTAECRGNCSCVAYAYSNISIGASEGDNTRCLVWMGELIDMEKVSQGGEDLYVRVTRLNGNKRKTNILGTVLLAVASLLMLICMLIWICCIRGKQRSNEVFSGLMLGDSSTSSELSDRKTEFPFFSFREIASATNNFSDSNILGHGGFGTVYKGIMEGDKDIAVKRLAKGSGQGVVEFKNEVFLIAKLQHRNLVKLLGCCIHGDEKLLIYEYLPNKSLDAFLFNPSSDSALDWTTRFKIIKGVARGLLYLHQDSRLTIIHRDLKASNVLLDADMHPKISDFGTARIFGGNEQQTNTNRVVGTYGYMAPEYALEGVISVKSDVYSFGVLLLEIVSGLKISKVIDPSAGHSNLIAYAWSLWKDGSMGGLVDSSVTESSSLGEALRCIHIALLSVQNNPNARPLMSWVVSSLDNKDIELPEPKEPMCFAHSSFGTDGAGESLVNDMSLATLEAR
ncbi:G-type lectin S-receptor-like serine/threonine-protein kinase B120 isoform X2 [Oryza brachyantha]|uniref:Receptor-like serine/threonine-protein kinase n=1 Tax=Oryza brachyantha TaxID=4533 RepID=J3MQW0_ORYBR|nr:G-type lectin S-receptor-like serine/threonine-protein kinase B120 isoform X2 [Oryza brachyantha]